MQFGRADHTPTAYLSFLNRTGIPLHLLVSLNPHTEAVLSPSRLGDILISFPMTVYYNIFNMKT